MAGPTQSPEDTTALLDRAFSAIASNHPPGDILAMLDTLPPTRADADRARWLVARGVTINRLGLASEALGDLSEALDLAARQHRPDIAADAWGAIAQVNAWRGDGREAALALLQVLAVDGRDAAERDADIGNVLLAAGRIEMEIGRPARAAGLLRRCCALLPSGSASRTRALVELAQASIAEGDPGVAAKALTELETSPFPATPRQRHLASLAHGRVALMAHDVEEARRRLEDAVTLAPSDPDAFEHIEREWLAAEIALASGDAVIAAAGLRRVVARLAANDLAGPEIEARLLESQALDAVGDGRAADRTLAAALRRALSANLGTYADRIRHRLIVRGCPPDDRGPGDWPQEETGLPASLRFVRRRPLGIGGAASVWRAYDLDSGREVALKRLKPPGYSLQSREQWISEARREVTAATLVRHPGIARVLGIAVEAEDDVLLVRELVEGVDLRARMADPWSSSGALQALSDVAWGLGAIHAAGLAHGDIKPENVIVRANGRAVIIDLGASSGNRRASPTALTMEYASPQRLAGGAPSVRDDIHAFAVTACETLTGRRPGGPPSGLRSLFVNSRNRNTIVTDLTACGLTAATARLLSLALIPPLFGPQPDAVALAFSLEAAGSAARPS